MMNMNSIWNVSQKSILNKFIKYQFHLNSLSIFRYMANYNFTNCLPIKYSSFLKLSKSKNLPMICQNQESYHLPDGLRDAQRSCAASCQTLQYYTQIIPWLGFVNNQRNVEIYYYFKSNTEVYKEEYLVCNTEDWIGAVGGTLGLFIGFSFLGRIKEAVDIVISLVLNAYR